MKFCFSKLDSLTCNEKEKAVEDNLHQLFEYMKYPASVSALVGSTVDECDTEMRDKMDEIHLFASQIEYNLEKNILQLYLEEKEIVPDCKGNANLDVLKFWKHNMNIYPELSLMPIFFKYTY
uniref:HAT C-terminal dimerisation domain-containing protein n=1 Tax=Solanum lycopersicum TaxID=4081 RepID=A0A3Q7FIN2_SOLLC